MIFVKQYLQIQLNDIVAVRLGGRWYRGKLTSSHRTECSVDLVDYGRSEVVLKNDVLPIPESMLLFPALFVKLIIREEFFDMTRARSVIENLLVGNCVEIDVDEKGEYDYLGKFSKTLSEQITKKLEQELKPYTGMDPFNNVPNSRKVTPRNSISADSALGKSTVGPSLPELDPNETYDLDFGAFGENQEFSVIIKSRKKIYSELQSRLNAFCNLTEPIENLQNLTALYAVKLPWGEWVRATIVETLTSSDAEMELIDNSAQLRRCHLDQIVELTRFLFSKFSSKFIFPQVF